MICCPPSISNCCNKGFASEPESATHSRERRRVAVVVRELTAYLYAKFEQLEAKVDIATLGLVAIANRELETFLVDGRQEKQPDSEPSPERQRSARAKRAITEKSGDDEFAPGALFDLYSQDDFKDASV